MFLGWRMLQRQGGGGGAIAGDYSEDTRKTQRLDRAQHVGAIRPPPPRTVSSGSGSHPAPPPPPAGQSPEEAWTQMATVQGNTVVLMEQQPGGLARPAANSQPADIAAWLTKNNLSPLYLFPEFGWGPSDGKPLERHVSYDLGDNDHVDWWAALDGTWSYHHVWGGVNVGRLLDQIVNIVAIGTSLMGWPGMGTMLHTIQAIADHKPIGELGDEIKQDWTDTLDAARIAFAVLTGDFQRAWDAATDYGRDLQGLLDAFKGAPAPDRNGVPIIDQPSPLPHPMPAAVTHPAKPGLATVGAYDPKAGKRSRPSSKAKRRKR